MCSYFTKVETECSQIIVYDAKEAKAENNVNIKDKLRKFGTTFQSTTGISSQ